MEVTRPFLKAARLMLILTALVSSTSPLLTVQVVAQPSLGSYSYEFLVDEDGFTSVTVGYESSGDGSSWVFVPKFSNWSVTVSSGSIAQNITVETDEFPDVHEEYYFYQVFKFWFEADGSFRMDIRFNMTTGAFIIEPRGVFFSPQIGFEAASSASAEVILPSGSTVVDYYPGGAQVDGNRVSFPSLSENLVRLQIEFSTAAAEPEMLTLTRGIFTFNAVRRYESYASDILDLFSEVYNSSVDLFNVTLESVNMQFFIPEFYVLLSVGGYVPFTEREMGDIHLNLFAERFVEGVLEVIALHELVHHFLWRAGISPGDILWFHEGVAQYVSIELVEGLGYEGATSERERLEEAASGLLKWFNYLQSWSPQYPPANIGAYYAASYYVVSRLAEMHGGLDYYARFFKSIRGTSIEDNDLLTYHLNLAANTSVATTLTGWGFRVTDLYISSSLIEEAKSEVERLHPLFQPYRSLAEWLYRQGISSLEAGDVRAGNQYLRAAVFTARWAPLLTLTTVAIVLVAAVYLVRRRRALTEKEMGAPEVTPDFDQTLFMGILKYSVVQKSIQQGGGYSFTVSPNTGVHTCSQWLTQPFSRFVGKFPSCSLPPASSHHCISCSRGSRWPR